MNCGAEGHKGGPNALGPLGLEAGGGYWKEKLCKNSKGEVSNAVGLATLRNKPLYELPRGGHAGRVGNACELGKTWPEACYTTGGQMPSYRGLSGRKQARCGPETSSLPTSLLAPP